jgi:hypothetical protein
MMEMIYLDVPVFSIQLVVEQIKLAPGFVSRCGVLGWLCCRLFMCYHQLSSDREHIHVVLTDCYLLIKFVMYAGYNNGFDRAPNKSSY